MKNNYSETRIYTPCPKCGGIVSVFPEQWGYAFSARCADCGWEGEQRNIEATPAAALSQWEIKANTPMAYEPLWPKAIDNAILYHKIKNTK